MVWEKGLVRSFLAILTEWISEAFIRFLKLPLALLRTACRLQFALCLKEHSLTLRLEMVPGALEYVEPINRWPNLPLDTHEILERRGESLDGFEKPPEPAEYGQGNVSTSVARRLGTCGPLSRL